VRPLRVLQLNIGSFFEPDWDQRRHEVVAWIDRLEPDVVCMEEAAESATLPNAAGWIAEQASGDWHWVFGGGGFTDETYDQTLRWGPAILSRRPIDAQHVFRLPLAADPSPLVAAAPWTLLHASTAGLDVFAAHLAPAPSDGLHRQAQVLAIDEHVRALRGERDVQPRRGRREGMPAILCGDFNAEPDSDEIRFLCGLTALAGRVTFWQDAWRCAGDGGPGHTQDWRTHPIAAGLNVHRKRIDYVFVGDPFRRRGDAGRVLSATVVCDEPITGIQASDHMGVLAEIAWPDQSRAVSS
jgi:endonuclease/exonuclease/phosphatase family metal-dependent hydrolase